MKQSANFLDLLQKTTGLQNMVKQFKKIGLKPNLLLALSLPLTALTAHATCNPNIQSTHLDGRYTILSDGAEVKDKSTGLIWQRCSIGQTWNGSNCTGDAQEYSWKDGLAAAKNIGNGYRMPNIKELVSLVNAQCHEPAVNAKMFPNTPSDDFWSSSIHANSDGSVWGVNFKIGSIFSYSQKSEEGIKTHYVRAVRSE